MPGLFYSLLILFFLPLSLLAQEAKYKAALDSIAKYVKYTQLGNNDPVQLLTYYDPAMFNGMAEQTDSSVFYSMSSNYKNKIVFSDGRAVYMADLKAMDTSMVKLGRGIHFFDANGNVKFRKSAVSRIFNGKHGGVDTDDFTLIMSYTEENRIIAKKLMHFIREAILYSKKVKTKKGQLKFMGE